MKNKTNNMNIDNVLFLFDDNIQVSVEVDVLSVYSGTTSHAA